MRKRTGGDAGPTRRVLLAQAASAACLGVAGRSAARESAPGRAPLHIDIAGRARRLADGGGDLKLLLPQGCLPNVRTVIQAFRHLSGIGIGVKEVPVDEINTQVILDSLTGDAAYDLALPSTFGIPDLAAGGALHPLTDFARRHEPEGFRDEPLYNVGDRFDGEVYGFQTDGDAYMMFYHRDWLGDPAEQARYADRHGVALDIPRTWPELDRQMQFFHRPDQDRFGGALFRTPGYLGWEWWLRLHAKGVWPFSAEMEPQIASDAGIEALEEMIAASRWLYPHAGTAGLFDNWKHFARGNVFCNIGWGGTQKYLNGPKSAMRGRLLHACTPSARFGGKLVAMPHFNWGWNYVVTSVSKRPELAYLFALFASTSEMSTLSVSAPDGFFDPFRPEHYSDPAVIKAYSPEFLAVHRQSMRNAIPGLYLGHGAEYFATLNNWLDAAVNGTLPPADALRRVAAQWSILNLRTGRDDQRRRWRDLRGHYPSAVRAALRDVA